MPVIKQKLTESSVDFHTAMVQIHIMCNLTLPKDSTGT